MDRTPRTLGRLMFGIVASAALSLILACGGLGPQEVGSAPAPEAVAKARAPVDDSVDEDGDSGAGDPVPAYASGVPTNGYATANLQNVPRPVPGKPQAVLPGDDPAIDVVRRAVARALPYIQAEGVGWIEQHSCVSCHQVPVMLWSQHAAHDRGFALDADELDRRTRWSVEQVVTEEEDNWDGAAPMILGRPGSGPLAEILETSVSRILRGQRADGGWDAQGQLPLQRRPESESHRVSTLWSALALSSLGAEDGEVADALGRARRVIATLDETPGESLESLVTQALWEAAEGDRDRARTLRDELLGHQGDDGGWPWHLGESGDAFGTGQALYTLARLGQQGLAGPEAVAAIERGRRFLVETQGDDGSWTVRSTLKREEGPTPTGIYWGTGWAVIGLLETLPASAFSESPEPGAVVAAIPQLGID